MQQTASTQMVEAVAGFIMRFEDMGAVLQNITGEFSGKIAFTVRGETTAHVLVDFSKSKVVALRSETPQRGSLVVAADATVFDAIFSGREKPGAPVGRRELLLRGSPYDFSKVIPLFDIAPPLYMEHIRLLNDFNKTETYKESNMSESPTTGNAVQDLIPDDRSTFARYLQLLFDAIGFVIGFVLAMMQRYLFKGFRLFDLVGAFCAGLEAGQERVRHNNPPVRGSND